MLKIYLDIVFLVNFLLDFFILYGVSKVLKVNRKIYRLILGSLVGSLTTFLLFIKLTNLKLFVIKIIFSVLIILISLGKSDFMKKIIYFYLISIIIGGSFYLLDIGVIYNNKGLLVIKNNPVVNFMFLISGSLIIIYLFVKERINYKNTYANKYLVEIYINKTCYKLEGFIDTGNRLKDPYKKREIILVNLQLKKKNKYIYVPYKALNTEGIIPCLKPDKVIIDKKEFSNCLIGFSKDRFMLNGTNCILPNKFKEEL